MSDKKEKRSINIQLTEFDDGSWRATYVSDTMAGMAGGKTAGGAAQKLIDTMEEAEAKTAEIRAAVELGDLPQVSELFRRAAARACTCGQCPIHDNKHEADSTLN